MFSNNVYEAIYLGKAFLINQEISNTIRNVGFVNATLLLMLSWQLLKFILSLRDLDVSNNKKSEFIFTKGAKVLFCIYITGLILGHSTSISVSDYSSKKWYKNKIFQKDEMLKLNNGDYRVSSSLAYLLKIYSAFEKFIIIKIDETLVGKDNYTKESMATFRNIFSTATEQIQDDDLKKFTREYFKFCIVPALNSGIKFKSSEVNIRELSEDSRRIFNNFRIQNGTKCNFVAQELNRKLIDYVGKRHGHYDSKEDVVELRKIIPKGNFQIANLLNSEFKQINNEKLFEDEVEMIGASKTFMQYVSSIWSMKLFGAGAVSMASSASVQASQFIKFMPHVRGLLAIAIIGFFPIIVFFIAYNGLKYISSYLLLLGALFAINPIWEFLYKITLSTTTNLLRSTKNLEGLDGFSTMLVETIQTQSSRAYFIMFSVMVMIYAFIGYFICQSIMQKFSSQDYDDHAPTPVKVAGGVAAKYTSGGIL